MSYLTTAPAVPEMGTWNLGNEARGVKFVSAARAQGTERWSSFFSVRLAHSYTVLVPRFMTYINNLSLYSCGPVKHPILTPARERASAPLVGQEPAGTQLLSYGDNLSHAKITSARAKPRRKFSSKQSSRLFPQNKVGRACELGIFSCPCNTEGSPCPTWEHHLTAAALLQGPKASVTPLISPAPRHISPGSLQLQVLLFTSLLSIFFPRAAGRSPMTCGTRGRGGNWAGFLWILLDKMPKALLAAMALRVLASPNINLPFLLRFGLFVYTVTANESANRCTLAYYLCTPSTQRKAKAMEKQDI